jgi:hypothetical protein
VALWLSTGVVLAFYVVNVMREDATGCERLRLRLRVVVSLSMHLCFWQAVSKLLIEHSRATVRPSQNISRFSVTLNVCTHVWNIKYR